MGILKTVETLMRITRSIWEKEASYPINKYTGTEHKTCDVNTGQRKKLLEARTKMIIK